MKLPLKKWREDIEALEGRQGGRHGVENRILYKG